MHASDLIAHLEWLRAFWLVNKINFVIALASMLQLRVADFVPEMVAASSVAVSYGY